MLHSQLPVAIAAAGPAKHNAQLRVARLPEDMQIRVVACASNAHDKQGFSANSVTNPARTPSCVLSLPDRHLKVCREPSTTPCTPSTHPIPCPPAGCFCSLTLSCCALLRSACCAPAGVADASTATLSATATGTASHASRWCVWSGNKAWASISAPERQAKPAMLERAGSTWGRASCSAAPAGNSTSD